MMITAEQSLEKHGPIRVFDGDKNELKHVVAIDFETGEVIQLYAGYVPFWLFYTSILNWLDRKFDICTDWSFYKKHYFTKTPIRTEVCRRSTWSL